MKNPGVHWHETRRREADQQDRMAKKPALKDFFHGKSTAHLESGLAARAMGMNPQEQEISRKQALEIIKGTGKRLPRPGRMVITVEPLSYGGRTYGVANRGGKYFAVQLTPNPHRHHGKFRSCVRQVSRQRPRVRDPKAVCGAAMSRKNPIAIYGLGNPRANGRISAKIEGVIYNRVVEIKAEKTGYRPGFYRHPFSRKSAVQILALDNGDLLVHSTAGVRLWKRD